MPRTRAWRRHHRARVIARRYKAARSIHAVGGWGLDQWRYHFERQPAGQLATAQYWLGCNTPNCGLCHPSKRWHLSADRMRAEREWRRDWSV